MTAGGFGALRTRIDQLPAVDRRIVRFVIVAGTIMLIGVTGTGVAVFFEHRADPSWTSAAELGLGFPFEPASTRLEDAHATFGTLAGVIALIGGGVIALRVLYRLAGVIVASLAMTVAGAITGSIIRFNVVERSTGFDETAQGYAQFFGGDVVSVLTDRSEFTSTTLATLTVFHLLTVPVILVSAWLTLRRSDRERAAIDRLALQRSARRRARGSVPK